MYINSTERKQEIDFLTQRDYGISGATLMDRAGKSIFNELFNIFSKDKRIVVCCGRGNNGGDGFVISQYLIKAGYTVSTIYIDGNRSELNNKHFNTLKDLLAVLVNFDDKEVVDDLLKNADYIVDAILGIGLKSGARNRELDLINLCNKFDGYKIAIDIPSGIFPNRSDESCFHSDLTYTIGSINKEIFNKQNIEFIGKLKLISIGFPKDLLVSNIKILDERILEEVNVSIPINSYKNSRGHIGIYAGSKNYRGAALLCSKMASKSFLGLVSLFSCEKVLRKVLESESYIIFRKNTFVEKNINLYVAGSGWKSCNRNKKILKKILFSNKSKVLDAEAIRMFANLKNPVLNGDLIITPHVGEFRTFGIDSGNIIDDVIELARKKSCVVVYKSSITIIADKNSRCFVLNNPVAALGTGGSGDVLSGLIASMMSFIEDSFLASSVGVYIHNLAGERLYKIKGWFNSVELIDMISIVLKDVFDV